MNRRATIAATTLALVASGLAPVLAQGSSSTTCRSADWPMYGHDLAHTFAAPNGCSPITASNVATLVPKWFVHTRDSVTASPAVVGGVAYVGSWDGRFYAVSAATGAVKWTYQIATTSPTAFGRIVSSASVVDARVPGRGTRRIVIFGGGSSVWALDAATGHRLASIDLDPRTAADKKRKTTGDGVIEVESSPAVVPVGHRGAQQVYVGMDVHNNVKVGRTGLVSLQLRPTRSGGWRFAPIWKYDVETGKVRHGRHGLTVGSGHGFGCGGVWSSPALDTRNNAVYFGVASCDDPAAARTAGENYEEEMVALNARTGHRLWSFRPADSLPNSQRVADASNDADFGASPSLFRLPNGRAVVGEARKNAEYYVRDARTGKPVSTADAGQPGKVQDGFAVGGFLGTPGVELGSNGRAQRVIGATAIPVPHHAADVNKATWGIRGINPTNGALSWVDRFGGLSYAATSVVNGVAFVPDTANSDLLAIDATTGRLLWAGAVIGPPSSAAVVVGNSVYLGTGTRETDLEYKAVSTKLQDTFKNSIGESPLSPVSGIQAFKLAVG